MKFINKKLFSVKNSKCIINEACLKGIAERKFHEDEILRFVEKITNRCLESARGIDWRFQRIEEKLNPRYQFWENWKKTYRKAEDDYWKKKLKEDNANSEDKKLNEDVAE